MQPRKVAILLAVTALSVLTLFVITLIDGSAFGAETHVPGPDSKVIVEVFSVLGDGGSGDLLPPYSARDGHDFKTLSGPSEFAHDELMPKETE